MSPSDVVLDAETEAFDGFVEIATARTDHAVVERGGEQVGVVSLNDFYEGMRIASVGAMKRTGAETGGFEAENLERGMV